MNNKSTFLKSTLAILVSAALSSTAYAAEEAETEETSGLNTITITAQKRSESLQEVPLSVTAIYGDKLREDNMESVSDIGGQTPGLVFSAFSVGQPEIAIRGIGTKEDGAAASDSTVISVDDIYMASRTAQVFDIFDLERVEVLRGPQGTLYGKNSIGGSINFVTAKPTADLNARVRLTVGDNGRFDIGGMINSEISENLMGKFSFITDKPWIRKIPSHGVASFYGCLQIIKQKCYLPLMVQMMN